MRARLPLRLARSVFFAIVCVMLAALAHRLGGGSAPPPEAMLGAGAVVLTAAAGLAGRERSPVAISGLLVLAQVFLHELFDRTAPVVVTALPLVHRHGGLGVDLGMLVAHLTATLVTGWWLARGEAALWSILRRAGAGAARRLLAVLTVSTREPAARDRPGSISFAATGFVPRRHRALLHAVTRRGPPLRLGFRVLARAAGASSA
ncbi:MFS transporter [Planotetraspora sp. A-T 1434]|uniref:MFS transporter n=1 Tax=Planotetraspora sp. A-T 1434 TaxID=2979219 RepID=UPI0021C0E038|nr:MFS transporter [Planotetraspora sp. A-T 1434]MCT9935219.1 MFS transporter [Planotetraspora sp. A-T 1434]